MSHDLSRPIAVYGFVDRDAGSVASANFLILEELLKRGYKVDFYAIKGFISPTELIGRPGFQYLPVSIPSVERIWGFIESCRLPRLKGLLSLGFSQVSNLLFEREIASRIECAQEERPYSFFLMLGGFSPFATPGLLNVCWPQGAPNGEWAAIRSQRRRVIKLAGLANYLMLKSGYVYKGLQNWFQLANSELIICGSSWSRDTLIQFGADPSAVHSLPYPYDLTRFQPGVSPGQSGTITFLSLGRIVPRKRIDLLLDAFLLLRRRRSDVRLLIIGRFAYARGFETLLGNLGTESGVEYRPFIDRADVPGLLSKIDVVIQPSEMENLGSAIIEGLACGRPAILGPSNGTRDYVSASSIVFDEYTPESVCDAMDRMCEIIRHEPERLSAEAREAAEAHVSLERVTDQLLGFVEAARSS